MRILILDDNPKYIGGLWVPVLKAKQYEVEVHVDMAQTYRSIQSASRRPAYDIVLMDVVFDEPAPPELRDYADVVLKSQISKNHREFTSQALGLWLWHERKTLRQRYAYFSSRTMEHLPDLQVGSDAPEFSGADAGERRQLVCRRGDEGEVSSHVDRLIQIWVQKGWAA